MGRVFLPFALFLLAAPGGAAAQNSVYGVLGIGFPGRQISSRARALGGGAAAFDARSAVNPAAVTGFQRLAVTVSSNTGLRSYTARDSAVDGLSETRFPFGVIGGPVRGTPISFALGYATYAERTYDLVTTDTVVLRGEPIAIADQVSSEGGIVDVRGALAWRVSSRVSLGAAVHVISGSARFTTKRAFSSSDYRPLGELDRLAFSGFGLSAGLTAVIHPRISLAAAVRSDTRLEATRDSLPAGVVELPLSAVGGLFVALSPAVRWATTVEWRSWSDAAGDLAQAGGANAFDIWEIGSGIEFAGSAGIPLRLGFRYAQLPFSPTMVQAREISGALGTGARFASGRAALDLTIERVFRDGAGARERAWHISASLTVQP